MTALGEWLKQIVLIVILATMADLLLPTKAMQKYVRVVMGLAVIAAMLQPIVPFFKGDWADQMASRAWEESTTTPPPPVDPSPASLQSIMSSEEQKDINRYADPTLKSDIARRFACPVAGVSLRGTGSPSDPLTVQVTVGTVAESTKQKIRAYVATLLQLPLDRVTVAGGPGGNSGGF